MSTMQIQQLASGDLDVGKIYQTQYYPPFTPIYNAPTSAMSPDRLVRAGSKQSINKKGKALR